MRIRLATAADLPALQKIEIAAGEPFRELGMTEIAEDDPPAIETLEVYRAAGRARVATDESDQPVAYLIHETVDDSAHIAQISLLPEYARRGIGRALIEDLAERARARELAALTLTTFVEVPWNAPYYARLGFRALEPAELTPALRRIRARETELGLDRWPRIAMRRDLG
ncbi:GNAT family N-acetyltransferase [Nocardia huaxiensis]|uniref:GNAT family N-acetyltransferase n=1 Tax=Nocardia huaxiensis TaxID=2755382 RepID=A0A7D6VDB9_9NOCA|nr:GNAT family N-acetyltransferase [Nocardia huaxiensis]QLY29695.1 GNAT family N-acetyltransferase [Nocardia huaxiensis]UFS96730.1 GNAT family N-acetyltransferase [Nocardia huaxiensis]